MKLTDLQEATAILGRMLAVLQNAVPSDIGRPGAAFRYAIGDLQASGSSYISAASLGSSLGKCFTLAVSNGASIDGIAAVQVAMEAESPAGLPGIAVACSGIRLALFAEAKILATTVFKSSETALAALDRILTAFDAAQLFAADNQNSAAYQALITAAAAVSRDITTRAAPLPRIITYSLPRGMTSHMLAYRLYGDANRCDELQAENGVIHPAFMPAAGRALSE